MNARNFFKKVEQEKIIQAIKKSELLTSGELVVHIENHCKGKVLDRAVDVFTSLCMHETAARNGVLFYLAVKDHKFAIIGDVGINCCVDECFWNDVKEHMLTFFKKQQFAQGLIEGIQMAGNKLGEFFPYQSDDVNELSDDISFG